jgi:ELWxxDGT repeat protein
MRMPSLIRTALVLLLAISSLPAVVVYVDAAASGSNNGTSWANAYTSLTTALGAAVSGNEIWVKAGTYKPTLTTDRTITFQLKDGVAVYGGFGGTEATRGERDWRRNQTILSGEINAVGIADNSYHVVTGAVSGSTIFDGLVVRDGNADGTGGGNTNAGGGMYVSGSTIAIRNCLFTNNQSLTYVGGAVALYSGGTVDQCVFLSNYGRLGVALYNSGPPITVNNCLFTGNQANAASPNGSAIFLIGACTVTNCTFYNNTSSTGAGAVFCSGGTAVLRNCIVWGNTPLPQLTGSGICYSCIVQGGLNTFGAGDGSNNASDPLFINPGTPAGADGLWGTGDDGLIPATGPAINSGSVTGLPVTDLRGAPRNQGGAPDRGAYEKRASVLYVKKGNVGTGTGDSWANAVPELREALCSADGQEVWVAVGTYKPSAGTNRGVSLSLPDKAAFYGGFAGTETLRTQRDVSANPTYLSGDIGSIGLHTDDSYHVVTMADGCALDGFIVQYGNANFGSGDNNTGGGIWARNALLTIANCLVTLNNAANWGGGIYLDGCSATLTDVRLVSNTGGYGGGAFLNNPGSGCVLDRVVAKGNSSTNNGGGIFLSGGSGAILRNCVVALNTAGGTSPYGGGGVILGTNTSQFVNCTFSGNTATVGNGGGVNAYGVGGQSFTNCIFWGNAAGSSGPQINQGTGTSTATFCDFQSAFPAGVTCSSCITADPLFTNSADPDGADNIWATADDGLIPIATSPVLGAGTSAGAPSIDIRGVLRGPFYDIGAYERRTRIYVKKTASGANNGTSWTDAYKELRDALAATSGISSGDEVWVAAGTYTPTSGTTRTISFVLPAGVQLYGGFSGGETLRTQRNWKNNPVILSGDIGAVGTVTDNSYQVVVVSGTGCVLDGVTVSDGNGSSYGAGIYGDLSGTFTLANCSVRNNSGAWGGGIWLRGCELTMADCQVIDNTGSGYGGGMLYQDGTGSPSIDRCVFNGNVAAGGWGGGGLFIYNGLPVQVRNCLFTGNTASGNSSWGGGGVFALNSATLTNCTFQGNSVTLSGGYGGGLDLSGSASLRNCIFWDNTATNGPQVRGGGTAYSCDFQGGLPTGTTDGGGNLAADPLFTNSSNPAGSDGIWATDDDGLLPLSSSPTRDVGTATGAPTTDLRGLPRPSGGGFDIGCYERQLAFVNAAASGTNTGASWANAYSSLQSALATASGDEIWVAKGTYTPTLIADRTATFQLRPGLRVYGGFVGDGSETQLSQRNWIANQTVLSGDIPGSNSYHVVTLASNGVLDGFIVRDGVSDFSGGGILASGCTNLTVVNCRILGNSAPGYGGGASLLSCTGTLSACVFADNDGGFGGGVASNSTVIVTNCVFTRNRATTNATLGGGAFYQEGASATIQSCTFTANRSESSAGGQVGGGAICAAFSATVNLANCILWSDYAAVGAAEISSYSGGVTTAQYCNIAGGYAGTGNLASDPLFINASSPVGSDGVWTTADDGLRLRTDSPCVDTGTSTGAPATDIMGLARPLGGVNKFDRGAYEGRVPLVSFATSSSTWSEGGTASIAVTLSGASDLTVSVPFSIIGGTATPGADYNVITASPLVFTPGQTTATIQVTIIADGIGEDEERFHLQLANPVNARINQGDVHTAFITASDAPVITTADQSCNENDGSVTITATLTGDHQGDLKVRYQVRSGTAVLGLDAGPASGWLTWLAGVQGSRTFTIPVYADQVDEPDETLLIDFNVDGASNASFTSPAITRSITRTLTIHDDPADVAGLVVTETGGNTAVSEATPTVADTYAIRLASQPEDQVAAVTLPISAVNGVGISTGTNALCVINGVAYYACDDGVHGTELWRSDGTSAGTYLVKDINPGSGASSPAELVNLHDYLIFTADNGTNGREIWVSDGTATGTIMLRDINPSASSGPTGLTVCGDAVYFTANDGSNGAELWKTGVATGTTVLVKDIYAGSTGSSPSGLVTMGSRVYFAASSIAGGRELWTSDGTSAGTIQVADIYLGTGGSSPSQLAVAGQQLFFLASDFDGATKHGNELWVSDGTTTGTHLVKDFQVGTGDGAYSASFGALGSILVFGATDSTQPTIGKELWASDGSSCWRIGVPAPGAGEIRPGTTDPQFSGWTAVNGSLVFAACAYDKLGTAEPDLWMTDGTNAYRIGNIRPGTYGCVPQNFFKWNDGVKEWAFFLAYNEANGWERWLTDGTTANTRLLGDLWPGTNSGGGWVGGADATRSGMPFFFAATTPTAGSQLWVGSGTGPASISIQAAATVSTGPQGSDPDENGYQPFMDSSGRIWFEAWDPQHGYELWIKNGASYTTYDINSGIDGSYPNGFAEFGGYVYFSAYDPTHGYELWRSDGSAPQLFADLYSGITDSYPGSFTVFAGKLYFTATTAATGTEIFSTNGTMTGGAGTGVVTVVTDSIAPGAASSSPGAPVVFGGWLYFYATDATHGSELWRTDGTSVVRITDLNPGAGSGLSWYSTPTVLGGQLLFIGDNGSGRRLWSWDGSTLAMLNGTVVPSGMTVCGSRVFFNGYTATEGYELWVSDGTPAGTVLVKDIWPGTSGSNPYSITALGNQVLFTAADAANGTELWRSDGTAAGTALVSDIAAGSASGYPYGMTEAQGLVYFSADDGINGRELWCSDGLHTRMVRDLDPGADASNTDYFYGLGSGTSRQVWFRAYAPDTGYTPWIVTPRRQVITCTPNFTATLPNWQVTLDGTAVGTAVTRTFNMLDWNVDRTISVNAIDDLIAEDNPHTTAIAHTASTTDPLAGGATPLSSVTVSITDNDTASATISAISGHTTESGGTAFFTIVLGSQPTANVRFYLSVNSPSDKEGMIVTPAVGYLDFTPGNWNSAQTVTVRGVDDFIADGNVSWTVTVANAVSTDSKYNGRFGGTVSVVNDDNDTAGFALVGVSIPTLATPRVIAVQSVSLGSPFATITFTGGTDLSTVLPGMRVTLSGGLNGGKAGHVATVSGSTITLSQVEPSALVADGAGSTATIGALTAPPTRETSFVFTSVNTTAATRRVQLPGGTDLARVRVGMSVVFSGGGANSGKSGYVTAVDDVTDIIDVGSAGLANAGAETMTIGGYAVVALRLTSQPLYPVTVQVRSSDTTEGTLGVSSIQLDAGNWSAGVPVTITAVDDAIIDGDITYTGLETTTTSSTDANYNNKNPPDAQVVNLDDDSAGFEIVQSGGTTTVTEGGGTDTYQIRLRSLPSADVTVTVASDTVYGVNVDTGTPGQPTQLVFTAGNWNSWRTVTVTAVDDTRYEGPHTDTIRHSSTSADANYIIGDLPAHRITVAITDNDSPPVLNVADVSVNENAGNAVVTVTPSNASATGFSVTWQTVASGTATAVSDYTAVAATVLSWVANDASAKTVSIPIINDTLDEDNETFPVRFNGASNCSIAGASGGVRDITVTIIDDDPPPTVSFALATSNPGEAAGTVNVQVTLSAASGRSISVPFNVGGSATPTTDYSLGTASPLLFNPGDLAKSIPVTIVNDSLNEDDETVVFTLGTPTNAVVAAPSSHTLTIVDNDPLPTASVHVAGSSCNEGDGTVSIQVDLSTVSGRAVSVPFHLGAGTATAGVDFTLASASPLIIPANTLSAQIQVSIINDTLFEGDETVVVVLDPPTNATLGAATHTLTIHDDDSANKPKVGFSAAAQTRDEGDGTATVTVQLDRISGLPVTVNIGTGGTATVGSDYTLTPSGSITIPAGSLSGSISVNIIDDDLYEGDETLTLTLSGPVNAGLDATTTHTITIHDNDPVPTLAISDVSTIEGNADHPATVTVTMTGKSATLVSVDFATSDLAPGPASATAGVDYTATAHTFQWTTGQTGAKTFTVNIVGDLTPELNESAQLNLSNPVGATFTISTATLTILDDDGAQVILTPTSDSVTEGLSKSFQIHLYNGGGPPTNGVHVAVVPGAGGTVDHADLYFDNGAKGTATGLTAANAVDYLTDLTVTVTATNDNIYQGNRTVVVTSTTFSADLNFNNRIGLYSLSITDDELPPVLTIASTASCSEGGAWTTSITVTPSVASASVMRVNWATVEQGPGLGYATASADYSSASGSLIWAAGDASAQTITVPILQDNLVEHAETFQVQIAGAVNCSIPVAPGADTCTVTITDDDSAVLSINNVSISEGNSGTSNLDFTVSLNKPSVDPISVLYATADGTATVAGNDYVATSGTLTIPAGSLSGIISVPIKGDLLCEADETFTVTLSGPTPAGVTIGTGTGTGTIQNDDAAPTLAIADIAVDEGAGTVLVPVTMTGYRDTPVTVQWSTVAGAPGPGIASAGADFTAVTPTVLTWNPGETGTKTVAVTIIDDLLNEDDETFTVHLAVPVGAGITTADSVVTIHDNDPLPTVSFTIDSQSGSEGDAVLAKTAVVQLSAASGRTVTVPYGVSGTATQDSDYTIDLPSPLVFAPGETAKTITITIIDDSLVEPAETAVITLAPTASMTNAARGATYTHTLTINDNDVASILIQPATALTTTEGGSSAMFAVRLSVAPAVGSPVTVRLDATAGAGEGVVIGAVGGILNLPFTSTTWNQWQLVTVQGVDDLIDDGDRTWTLTSSASGGFSIPIGPNVSIRNLNNDTAAVVVDTNGGVAVNEDGGGTQQTYVLRLATVPTGPVAITATADSQVLVDSTPVPSSSRVIWFDATATGDGSSAVSALAWNNPGNVAITVTAVQDHVAEGSPHYGRISHSASGGGYDGVAIAQVTVSITDSAADVAGFDVGAPVGGSPSEALGGGSLRLATITPNGIQSGWLYFPAGSLPGSVFAGQTVRCEDGTNAGQEFAIASLGVDRVQVVGALDDAGLVTVTFFAAVPVTVHSKPTAQVTLPVASSNPAQATVSPAYLSFSADAGWATPRYITVRAVDDQVADNGVTVTVTFNASVSADPRYHNLAPSDSAPISLINDDVAGLVITYAGTGDGPTFNPTTLRVTEAGSTAVCHVRLKSQPLANITIPLTSSASGQGGVSPASLLFTPLNWNIDQAVTVSGADGDGVDNPANVGTSWSVVTGAPVGSPGGDGYAGLTGNEAGFEDIAIRTLPSNAAPVFNAITDQSFSEDPATAKSVSVTGITTGQAGETQHLWLRATSSKPELIPDPQPTFVDLGNIAYAVPVPATPILAITPAANQNGSAIITVTVMDEANIGAVAALGIPVDPARSTSHSFTVTVAAVNDPPVVDLNGSAPGLDAGNVTYREGDVPKPLAVSDVTVSDVDSPLLVGATAVLAGGSPPDSSAEVLSVTTGTTGIAANWDPITATLVMTGAQPPSAYQQLLRTLSYSDGADAPSTIQRMVEVRVDDGAGIQATGTATLSGGGIGSVAIGNPGAGYGETPTVTISGDGTGATATATVAGGMITAITVAVPGTGYTTATVSISSPRCLPAHAFVTVEPTNDAPLLSGAGTFLPIVEDQDVSDLGTTVDALILSGLAISDPDNGSSEPLALQGMAVIAADTSHGSWEYSLDNHVTWLPLGSPSQLQARLLAPTARLRFRPAADFNGSATLTIRAWDQTSSAGNGAEAIASAGFTGGTTAFSDATAICTIAVTPMPDAPVVDLNGPAVGIDYNAGSFTEDLGPVPVVASTMTVHAADTGTLISATVSLDAVRDTGAETLSVDTSGTAILKTWHGDTGILDLYTVTGPLPEADWTQVLRTLRYDNSDQAPDPTARVVQVVVNDGALTSAPAFATVPVVPVNDAPLVTDSAMLTAVPEDVGSDPLVNTGDLVSDLISTSGPVAGKLTVADPDLSGIAGLAITAAESTHGSWEFSFDDGATWSAVGAPTVTSTLLLDGGARVRFVPDADWNGAAILTVRAWDETSGAAGDIVNTGAVGSTGQTTAFSVGTATCSVTVTPINDPPVVDLDGPPATSIDVAANYPENSGPLFFAIPATVDDLDSSLLQGMTVTLVEHPDGVQESLTVDTTGTVISTTGYDTGTGVLQLNGPDTPAAFQQVLRTLRYQHTSLNPTGGLRHITVVTNDGALPSATATATLTILPVNDPPVVTFNAGLVLNFGQTVTIDTGRLAAVDPESDPPTQVTFTLLLAPNKGQLRLNGVPLGNNDTFTADDLANNRVTYAHGGVLAGADGFAFNVQDSGGATSAAQVFNIAITGLSPPVVTLVVSSLTFTEGDSPLQLDANATITDSDSPNFIGGNLTVAYQTGGSFADDTLQIADLYGGKVTVSANIVSYLGNPVGTLSGGNDGAALVVSFTTAAATPTAATWILRSIQYVTPSLNPSAAPRVLRVTVNDGGLTCVTPQDLALTVVPVNNAPIPVASTLRLATVVDLPVAGQVVANDPDSPPPTYALSDAAGNVNAGTANGMAILGTVTLDGATGAFTYQPAVGQSAQDDTCYVRAIDDQGAFCVITIIIHITGPDEAAPRFASNAPMHAMSASPGVPVTLIYSSQLQGGPPANVRWTLINPPPGMILNATGNLNWSVPDIHPAVNQYFQFGILVEDTVANRAAYQPVLIKVVVPPAGNG